MSPAEINCLNMVNVTFPLEQFSSSHLEHFLCSKIENLYFYSKNNRQIEAKHYNLTYLKMITKILFLLSLI